MNCYTYYIYHRPTGYKYYGCRYNKGCCPSSLWTTYFTSSPAVKSLIELYGKDSFDVQVRRTFGSDKVATQHWEKRVLQRIGAVRRTDYLNANVGGIVDLDPIQEKQRLDKARETKAKRSYVPWNKGKIGTMTDERRQQVSELMKSRKGVSKPEGFGDTIRKRLKGRPKSETHRTALRNANLGKEGVRVTDGHLVFASQAEAARHHNVTAKCIEARCKSATKKQSNWQFI